MTRPTALPVLFQNIPEQLKALDRWVLWRFVKRQGANGKTVWAKMPFTAQGNAAKSNNPKTWTSYDEAADTLVLGGFDGIGVVLGDDLHGIDLDDCRNPDTGELLPIAQEVLDRVEGYAEVSPSGTGIKIFTSTNLDSTRTKKEVGVELYRDRRYFTVTGHSINGHCDLPGEVQDLDWFVQKVWGEVLSERGTLSEDASAIAFANYREPLEGWDLDRVVEEILPHLDPDCGYEEWLKIGAAMHHQGQGDEEWLTAWDEWSEGSGKYVDGECEEKWKSFKPQRANGVITLATLIKQTGESRRAGIKRLSQRSGFRLIPASDLLKCPAEEHYLISGIIESGALGAVVGDTGTCKSFLAISMAASISLGIPWYGRKVEKSPVVFIAGEGHAGFGKRLRAWEIHNESSLAGAPLHFSTVPVSLTSAQSMENASREIDRVASEEGAPGLVIIDTLHRNFGDGDENQASDMATVIAQLDELRSRFKCAVLLIHHVGHNAPDLGRGSSSFRAALDFEFLVSRMLNSTYQLESKKSKESSPPDPIAFCPREVVIPEWVNPDGAPYSSLVLEVTESVRTPRSKKLTGANKVAFDVLTALQGDFDNELLAESAHRGVPLTEWQDACYSRGISNSDLDDSKRRAFERARQALMDQGRVQCFDNLYRVSN